LLSAVGITIVGFNKAFRGIQSPHCQELE